MSTTWQGVYPALTTKFNPDLTLDLDAIAHHAASQSAAGVDGIVILGSLGENATLTPDEKVEVVTSVVRTVGKKVPVISCVSETSTAGACRFIERTSSLGLSGYMVLPGMQYHSDRRETIAHFRRVAHSSPLPIMVYNNPVAYRVDITPEMFAELSDEKKFVAIKESSGNVRRITDIRNLTGDRYAIFAGVDDLAYESLLLGAAGWVAGLVCAFPKETVAIYRLLKEGRTGEALNIYRWFMPMLHLDTHVKFVQYIKLAETLAGTGTEWVRPPRLTLEGNEREEVSRIITDAIKSRPDLPKLS